MCIRDRIQALRGGTRNTISRSRTAGPVTPEKAGDAAAGNRMGEQRTAVELVPSMEALSRRFQDEMARGQIEIHLEARGLVISLRQAAFFASGKAELNPDTYSIVDQLGGLIHSLPNHVNLEGHTDAVPIRNSRFASNWELSAARSIAMLDQLAARGDVYKRQGHGRKLALDIHASAAEAQSQWGRPPGLRPTATSAIPWK